MLPIQSFFINGLEWKIEVDESLQEDFGQCHPNERVIKIGVLGLHALIQKRKEFWATLIHEIMHAVRASYGIDYGLTEDQEEKSVRLLEAIVIGFILSNPEQTKMILGKLLSSK
jgi:hypothetical protein